MNTFNGAKITISKPHGNKMIGTVVGINIDYDDISTISIKTEDGIKQYLYPDSFNLSLKTEDENLLYHINRGYMEEKNNCEEDKKRKLEKLEQQKKLEKQREEEKKQKIKEQEEAELKEKQRQLEIRDKNIRTEIKTNAYEYLVNDRKILHLVHFTPFENINKIMELGLLPRNDIPKTAIALDQKRLDRMTDCNCLSIEFPNYKMFWKNRQEYSNLDFAVLSIKPEIMLEKKTEDVYFCSMNAAGTFGTIKNSASLNGVFGAKHMFEDEYINVIDSDGMYKKDDNGKNIKVSAREETDLGDSYPTNPQAEVLIRGRIPTEFINLIYVQDFDAEYKLKEILPEKYHYLICINPYVYKPRRDYKLWRNY